MSERGRGRPRSRSRSNDRDNDSNRRNPRPNDNRRSYGGDRDRGGNGNSSRQSYGGRDESSRPPYRNDRGYGDHGNGNNNRGHGNGDRGGRSGGFDSGRGQQSVPITETKNIELYSNFFEMISKPNWILYQYHVDFEPLIESKRLRIGLMKQHDNLFSNVKAFDGMTLYSLTKLDRDVTDLVSVKQFDQKSVNIKIKLVGEIRPGDRECLRLMNIVFKRCLTKSKFIEFGRERAYFDFDNMHEMMKYRLKIAAGYKASIDVYQSGLLLCTEIAHKLINFSSILEVMKDIYKSSSERNYKERCNEKLLGCTMMTNYNKKTYRIDDIAWDYTPAHTFDKKDGTKISFADYYYEHYKIKIMDMNQPLLVSLPKERDKNRQKNSGDGRPASPIMLIPELCVLTGMVLLKDFARDFQMKKDMDAITKLNPSVRIDRLRGFINKISRQEDARKDLEMWQMRMSEDVVRCNALVLKSEIITLQNNTTNDTVAGWNNIIKDGVHLVSVPLKNWVLIYMARDDYKAEFFMKEVTSVSNPMGFRIDKGLMTKITDRGSNPVLFAQEIKNILRSSKPQMLVCILPNTAKDTYDAIKVACCIEHGIPSQCVTSSILDTNKMGKAKSAITKIAIQMNCKLGGVIWGLTIPLRNIMIVGIDVYKDSARRNQSVAAFVASTNGTQEDKLNCTKYYSKCEMQPRGQEYINHLQMFMSSALNKYHEKNNTFPDRIFVYRDGVSDGQFPIVKEFEVTQLQQAFRLVNTNYNPKLTFLVVKKRGNTRFFYNDGRDFINPPMGTVVNSKVVKNEDEFYLVSQTANRGTVTPTHFHILEKPPNDLGLDKIQILTFKLTHLYYNWPGQIRVPGICQYATKLAHLVGETLHDKHAPSLDDKLFYL